MKSRCNNPKASSYRHYGAKGVRVEWPSFETFKRDMYSDYRDHVRDHGERNTTIERIDNSDNYSKKNCRWATYLEQLNNTSRSRPIEFQGKVNSLRGWALAFSISPNVMWHRVRKRRMTLLDALRFDVDQRLSSLRQQVIH